MLEEKAEDLGRVLGQTDEYKALRRATEALREDQAVQKVLAEAERPRSRSNSTTARSKACREIRCISRWSRRRRTLKN